MKHKHCKKVLKTFERALLQSLGIDLETSDTSDSVCESNPFPSDLPGVCINSASSFSSEKELNETLSRSRYNWFNVVASILARFDSEKVFSTA